MSNVTVLKPTPRESIDATIEVRILTIGEMEQWNLPPVQGTFRLNKKVLEYVSDLKSNGGIIGGTIRLGRLPNDPRLWLVDGLHRREGARMSGLSEFLAEIRTRDYASMGELADDFVKMNTPLSRKRPDDILRALEENLPALQIIRKQCPFVGYDNIRRCSSTSATVGMTQVLRCWHGASQETPGGFGGSSNPAEIARSLDNADVEQISTFLNTVHGAWGTDAEYYRLWNTLNMTMCMWLFKQLVLTKPDPTRRKKVVSLTVAQFGRCMMSLSAAGDYVDWTLGRNMSERDRSPCYTRIKRVIAARVQQETGRKPNLPQPAWYSGSKK